MVDNMNNDSIGDKLFDEENSENIKLVGDDGVEYEFEQVATIPLEEDGKVYCILHPVVPMDGMSADEGLVMELSEDIDTGEDVLLMVTEDEVIDKVFAIYEELLREQENTEG